MSGHAGFVSRLGLGMAADRAEDWNDETGDESGAEPVGCSPNLVDARSTAVHELGHLG
jgi:hypothetical protein